MPSLIDGGVSICENFLVTPDQSAPDLSQIYKEKYSNGPQPMYYECIPPTPSSVHLAPSRCPVSRRSALRQPRPPPRCPCKSLASDSLPVYTHLSDSDYKSKISPSSSRSTKIRYAQLAVVLYSYLPVLQHEHDGFSDCKKIYI